jgi:hypothetical protein
MCELATAGVGSPTALGELGGHDAIRGDAPAHQGEHAADDEHGENDVEDDDAGHGDLSLELGDNFALNSVPTACKMEM